jgi:hypothetical protein
LEIVEHKNGVRKVRRPETTLTHVSPIFDGFLFWNELAL